MKKFVYVIKENGVLNEKIKFCESRDTIKNLPGFVTIVRAREVSLNVDTITKVVNELGINLDGFLLKLQEVLQKESEKKEAEEVSK